MKGPTGRVAAAAAVVTGSLLAWQAVRAMGGVYGVVILSAALGAGLMMGGGRGLRRLGGVFLSVGAGLLSLGTWLWIVGWQIAPFSEDGVWLWPLAMLSAAIAVFAAVRALRPGRRDAQAAD